MLFAEIFGRRCVEATAQPAVAARHHSTRYADVFIRHPCQSVTLAAGISSSRRLQALSVAQRIDWTLWARPGETHPVRTVWMLLGDK